MTYNSVFALAFSIDHATKDGSDITADQFRAAVLRRLDDLGLQSDDDWHNALGQPEDTYDKETDA
jgi:hypothetical protein